MTTTPKPLRPWPFGTPQTPLLATPRPPDAGLEHLILDLEIQQSIGGSGGLTWEDTHRMGVSIAVVYAVEADQYTCYGPDDLPALRLRLEGARRITTFNGWTFDLPVLYGLKRPQTVDHLQAASDDLLARIWAALGRREKGWTLNDIARGTLGRGKLGHGAAAPLLYQQGRWVELINYCVEDVRLLRDVLRYHAQHGRLSNGVRPLIIGPWEVQP